MCYDVFETDWSFDDVTDVNAAYPNTLTVTAMDCEGTTVDLSAGETYTPESGCAWNTTFQLSGDLGLYFTLSSNNAAFVALHALALAAFASF